MARRPGRENAPRQAPDTPAPSPGLDRQPGKSKIALPADLGRSLRLLDDAQLDRLTKAVTDESGGADAIRRTVHRWGAGRQSAPQ